MLCCHIGIHGFQLFSIIIWHTRNVHFATCEVLTPSALDSRTAQEPGFPVQPVGEAAGF